LPSGMRFSVLQALHRTIRGLSDMENCPLFSLVFNDPV
jgi:hypothetical protein